MERTEKLYGIIDDQASANQFYFDYPPKPDPELEKKTDEKAASSESEKVKKMFEEQIATLKRSYEREYNEMITTFA